MSLFSKWASGNLRVYPSFELIFGVGIDAVELVSIIRPSSRFGGVFGAGMTANGALKFK